MEEIINSVMQTPSNTNPNVLRGQLQGMASSSGGVLVVHDNDDTLDKTWEEIRDADFAVLKTVKADPDNGWDEGSTFFNAVRVAVVLTDGQGYNVTIGFDEYHTDSASGYPVKVEGGGVSE